MVVAVERTGALRRRALLVCGIAGLAIVAGVVVERHVTREAQGPHTPSASIQIGACAIVESYSGYPDRFLTRRMPFKIHPPLPVRGWRPRGLAFDVLFHSLFHGYLVIEYRPGLPPRDRVRLRTWVTAHGHERVVAVPTQEERAPLVALAEWGWEGRCGRVPGGAELTRCAARRIS